MNNVTLLTSSLYNFKSTNYLQYDIDRQDSITTDYFNVSSQYKFTSSAKANYSTNSNNNDVTIPYNVISAICSIIAEKENSNKVSSLKLNETFKLEVQHY